MAAIVARAKKIRSETVFAMTVWLAARIRRTVRRVLARLSGAFHERVQQANTVTDRKLTY
jgi:hypothetical protein